MLSRGGIILEEELGGCNYLVKLVMDCEEGMLVEYSLCSDSVMSICWIISEERRQSLYHRNKVVQVRFHTELEKINHVKSDHNPADIWRFGGSHDCLDSYS